MRYAVLALTLAGCSADSGGNGVDTADERSLGLARAILAESEASLRAPGVASASIGGVARLNGREIRPIGIVEDNLCPVESDCIDAGTLRLKVSISGVPGEPVLELHHPFDLSGGEQITLVAVFPPPFNNPPPEITPDTPRRFGFKSSQGQSPTR